MSNHFAVSANVHHPIVKSVFRLKTGELSIQLGQERTYHHVSVLVTDDGWRQLVRDADEQIAAVPNPGDNITRAAVKNDDCTCDDFRVSDCPTHGDEAQS